MFLYDHIGGRKRLPPTRSLDLRKDAAGVPLKPAMTRGFEYSDCWVMDARLVALNARDAAARGAQICTRTEVTSLERRDGGFIVSLKDVRSGQARQVQARLVVNAAGPWVDHVLNCIAGEPPRHHVRLVQGSHIVVRKLYDHDRCYIFQNRDGRVIFAIPYENDFTLIGTTDRDYQGDPADVRAGEEEVDYLCAAASEYFREPVTRDRIVWRYSGVRPLYNDGASKAQETTREYVLTLEGDAARGALLNIFGGKITTYRHLAESALVKIESVLGRRGLAWTRGANLPGGDFPVDGFEALLISLRALAPRISACDGAPFGAGLWHRSARHSGGWRSGSDIRCRSGPAGSGFPDGKGMGAHRRRHFVAAEQAGIALFRRRSGGLARYLENGHSLKQASG